MLSPSRALVSIAMFAAGLKEVSFEKGATSGQKRHLDFVSSAFSDRQLESKVRTAAIKRANSHRACTHSLFFARSPRSY